MSFVNQLATARPVGLHSIIRPHRAGSFSQPAKTLRNKPYDVVLLHGFLGNSAAFTQFLSRASTLESLKGVVRTWSALDLRGHGLSPQVPTTGLAEMTADVASWCKKMGMGVGEGSSGVVVVGHSLGGKLGALLALTSERSLPLAGLVGLDVAPVSYEPGHGHRLKAMHDISLEDVKFRRDADAALAKAGLEDRGERGYLLSNLGPNTAKDGPAFRWNLDLNTLRGAQSELAGFPSDFMRPWKGKSLFVGGENSQYLKPHIPAVKRLFPQADVRILDGAGHFPHVQKMPQVLGLVEDYLLNLHRSL